MEIEDERMTLELEDPPPLLSLSELGDYEEQVKKHLEASNCTEQVADVMKALVDACHNHIQSQESEAVHRQPGSRVHMPSVYEMFSILLTSQVVEAHATAVSGFLHPLLEQFITNGWGGALTPTQMSDLLEAEICKREKIPNYFKSLLAESFVLSLCNQSEDDTLLSTVNGRVFAFLVTHATSDAGNELLLPMTWILTHSSISPEKLGSTVFPVLIEFLKHKTEDQFLQNDSAVVLSILRLVRDKCRNFSVDTVELIGKYLASGSNQTGRMYSAQWLKIAATENKSFLNVRTLTVLRNSE